MQREQAFGLQPVELPADVQATVVELVGYLLHQHIEGLRTGRILAAREEEAHQTVAQRTGGGSPDMTLQALRLGSHDVEHIDAEDELRLQQQQHLLLVDGDEAAGREGAEGRHMTLMQTEEQRGLHGVGSRHDLNDAAGAVVGGRLALQRAADEEDEVAAVVALGNNALTGLALREAQLGMRHHLHEVGMAHTLEERKLQQSVVYLHRESSDSYCPLILDFSEGEYQTPILPRSS